jgi:hypothetical protein
VDARHRADDGDHTDEGEQRPPRHQGGGVEMGETNVLLHVFG